MAIGTDQSPVILNIRDMQTGIEQSLEFDPKYNTGGGFVWSPDGEQLVFSVTQYDLNTAQYIGTSIMLWDRQTSEVTELIEDHPGRMQVIEWVDDLKIILLAEMYEPTQLLTQKYEFDLATQTLTEIVP